MVDGLFTDFLVWLPLISVVPVGFGAIFLNDILAHNINTLVLRMVLPIQNEDIPAAMFIPVFGMFIGLLFALFVSYRKPRHYQDVQIERTQSQSKCT